MIKSLLTFLGIGFCAVGAAYAGVNDVLPTTNVCAGGTKWKTRLIVADMNGDGGDLSSCTVGADAGGVYAETSITCTSKERVGVNVDFALQIFEPTGANLTPASPDAGMSACTLAPGESVTFVTNGTSAIPRPWAGTATTKVVPFSSSVLSDCPAGAGESGCLRHGSARVIATSNKIQCTAVRLDMGQFCASGGTAPPVVKNLSLFPKAPSKGD